MWLKYIAASIKELTNLVKTLDQCPRGTLRAVWLLFAIGFTVGAVVMIYFHYLLHN